MLSKTILISGSGGFVGQNLRHFFEIKEKNLRLLKRDEYIKLDDSEVDIFIHLAGKAHDLKKTSDPDEYYQVNTELTKKIYNAFLQSDAKVFITLSSVKAAADEVDGILTEEIDPKPATHYGKSKLLAEQYIFSQPVPEDKRVYILRPCMIHGPGNKGNLNLLFSVVKKGLPYPLAAFDNKRSFLSIDNLCFFIENLIADNSVPSGIYNVADDDALSTNEVIRIISEEIGKKARLWNVPKTVIKSIAKMGNILHLPLTTERLQKLTESYVVSNEKIKNLMKDSLPVSAEDGLRKTIRSFIKNNG